VSLITAPENADNNKKIVKNTHVSSRGRSDGDIWRKSLIRSRVCLLSEMILWGGEVTGEIIGTSRGGDDDQGRGSEEAGEGGGDIGGART
jgi:hypothetical protein